jgi:hypothetical protein
MTQLELRDLPLFALKCVLFSFAVTSEAHEYLPRQICLPTSYPPVSYLLFFLLTLPLSQTVGSVSQWQKRFKNAG